MNLCYCHVCGTVRSSVVGAHRIIAGISLMRDIPFQLEEFARARAVLAITRTGGHDSLQEDNNLTSILTAGVRGNCGNGLRGASLTSGASLNISLSTWWLIYINYFTLQTRSDKSHGTGRMSLGTTFTEYVKAFFLTPRQLRVFSPYVIYA